MSIYWPGTNIVKSKGNAFNWQNNKSQIVETVEFKRSQMTKLQMAGTGSDPKKTFTIYSKAKLSK